MQTTVMRQEQGSVSAKSGSQCVARAQDGEECVLGMKLTGDANVPAGAVSFRAKIGRRHRRGGYDMVYPPELEVAGRYAGEGRVAHKGFKDARCAHRARMHACTSSFAVPCCCCRFRWRQQCAGRHGSLQPALCLRGSRILPCCVLHAATKRFAMLPSNNSSRSAGVVGQLQDAAAR